MLKFLKEAQQSRLRKKKERREGEREVKAPMKRLLVLYPMKNEYLEAN